MVNETFFINKMMSAYQARSYIVQLKKARKFCL